MQHVKFEVHKIEITPGLTIIFKEGNGSIMQRDYIIEASDENCKDVKKYKSIFYVEKFWIYEKRNVINQWLDGLITTNDLKTKLIP